MRLSDYGFSLYNIGNNVATAINIAIDKPIPFTILGTSNLINLNCRPILWFGIDASNVNNLLITNNYETILLENRYDIRRQLCSFIEKYWNLNSSQLNKLKTLVLSNAL